MRRHNYAIIMAFLCQVAALFAQNEAVTIKAKDKTIVNPLVIFPSGKTLECDDCTLIGFGAAVDLNFINSLSKSGANVSLVNDSATPGNSKYYGTDSGGTKGFFTLPSGGTWGSITGTLSDQTDLQTALDAKLNGPIGGATTNVQINDAGALYGDSGLTYNKTTKQFTVTGPASGSGNANVKMSPSSTGNATAGISLDTNESQTLSILATGSGYAIGIPAWTNRTGVIHSGLTNGITIYSATGPIWFSANGDSNGHDKTASLTNGTFDVLTGYQKGGAEFPIASNGIPVRTAANTWSAITDNSANWNTPPHSVTLVVDGGGIVLGTGTKNPVKIPYGGTLTGWVMMCKPSGSVTADVFRATDGAGLPVTSIIGAGTKPSITTDVENSSTSFTNWTSTTLTAKDNLAVDLSGITDATYVQLTLYFR